MARLVAFGMMALVGCAESGASDPSNPTDVTVGAATTAPRVLTDAELAAELDSAPADPSEAAGKRLIDDALRPLATTARLKLLNDLAGKGPSSEGRSMIAAAMEGIVWGTPRDLVSAPAGFGGQSLTTTVTVESGIAAPSRLQITGNASAAYTLEFAIAGARVKDVHVPAGATPSATAKLIAAALDEQNEAIMKTIGDEKTFVPFGGDHADSRSGVDDLEISTSSGAVIIVVAQNG